MADQHATDGDHRRAGEAGHRSGQGRPGPENRKILALLQEDGRLTITELAERVQLSVSPCHRRLRALEKSRTITGYRAQLDPEALGLGLESLVFVTMRESDNRTLVAFEDAVANVTNIIQAQRLFGEPDYLLRIGRQRPDGFPTVLRRHPRSPSRRPATHVDAHHEDRRRQPATASDRCLGAISPQLRRTRSVWGSATHLTVRFPPCTRHVEPDATGAIRHEQPGRERNGRGTV